MYFKKNFMYYSLKFTVSHNMSFLQQDEAELKNRLFLLDYRTYRELALSEQPQQEKRYSFLHKNLSYLDGELNAIMPLENKRRKCCKVFFFTNLLEKSYCQAGSPRRTEVVGKF